MNKISITEGEDTFSGLDLHIIQKKASIRAEKFLRIQTGEHDERNWL